MNYWQESAFQILDLLKRWFDAHVEELTKALQEVATEHEGL